MKPNYSKKDFDTAKSHDGLPLTCYKCSKEFYKEKNQIQTIIKGHTSKAGKFCSQKCKKSYMIKKQKVFCQQCEKIFLKQPCEIKKSKSGNHFCSRSCSSTYNNLHKKFGTRKSKLECWIESKLEVLYPDLIILYNDKTAINSELDIYIPTFKLAFELNGIYHYEPIHGQKKLSQIQNNDINKFQACLTNNISLCIIDSSSLSYFKPDNAKKYLDIITNIIDSHLTIS